MPVLICVSEVTSWLAFAAKHSRLATDKAQMPTKNLQQMTNRSAQYRGVSGQGQKQ